MLSLFSFETLFIVILSIHFDFSKYYMKVLFLLISEFFGHPLNFALIPVPAVPHTLRAPVLTPTCRAEHAARWGLRGCALPSVVPLPCPHSQTTTSDGWGS